MTSARIIAEYERLEAAAGGLAAADARDVARETATALGLAYERVRDVLIAHWCKQGAG